jgi:dihydrolipoamide dehydrogenase
MPSPVRFSQSPWMKGSRFSDVPMIVVLGGGPAGRTAAVHLALNGREVMLVESGGIGGQCLHYGCMMVCALNDVARSLHGARNLNRLGILDAVPKVSFPRLLQEMCEVQEKIGGILDAETRGAGVTILYGKEGTIQGKNVLLDGEKIFPDVVIAATGSSPNIPEIPGIRMPGVFNPHTFSTMPSLPREIVIAGGGIMAAEFAYIFRQFGTQVSLVARTGLLKNLDPNLVSLAKKELEGVSFHEETRLLAVEGDERVERVIVEGAGGRSCIPCDAVFIAAGLVPRSGNIIGPEKKVNGAIRVDRQMRTSVNGLYACGDVTGSPCLTPVARREGFVAAENILGRETFMDYAKIPQFMALYNEYAFVETGNPCSVEVSLPGPAGPGTFWSVPSGMTGYARISVDPDSGELCGVHAAAPSAGIIAAYQAFLMRKGITVKEFDDFIEVHPMADGVYPLMKFVAGKIGKDPSS